MQNNMAIGDTVFNNKMRVLAELKNKIVRKVSAT